jgi:osmotically-inducible protein OsmY
MDESLKARVLGNICWLTDVPINEMTISVKNGVVTLGGFIPRDTQRTVVETMAYNTRGLIRLINNIQVRNTLLN